MNCLKLFLNILSLEHFEMKCCIVFLSKFIISICLKISFIKTTYADIKIVILSNEKFYYWYKYFYSIVQLDTM